MKKYNAPAPLDLVRSLRGPWVASALLVGLMNTLVPLASAGTIGISGGTLIVGSEAGDGSQSIQASVAGADLVITGVSNFDLVTPGCTADGSGSVDCRPLSGFNQLVVLGGNGDDTIVLSGITAPTFGITILGGPGDDVLIGSGGDDTIFGGPGDDILNGGPGFDCLSPGSGNNISIQAPTSCSTGPDPVINPLPRPAAAVPEPSGLWLLGTGLGLLGMTKCLKGRWRRAKQQRS